MRTYVSALTLFCFINIQSSKNQSALTILRGIPSIVRPFYKQECQLVLHEKLPWVKKKDTEQTTIVLGNNDHVRTLRDQKVWFNMPLKEGYDKKDLRHTLSPTMDLFCRDIGLYFHSGQKLSAETETLMHAYNIRVPSKIPWRMLIVPAILIQGLIQSKNILSSAQHKHMIGAYVYIADKDHAEREKWTIFHRFLHTLNS